MEDLFKTLEEGLAHLWMVRAFLKHSDEAAEDEELAEVHRQIYTFALAIAPAIDSQDAAAARKVLSKKLGKLRRALQRFADIQPQISGHTNYVMAVRSSLAACRYLERLIVPEASIAHAGSSSERSEP